MQQLEERNTYTPTDIPHIRSNCGRILNREETLSVSSLKTSSNNSDAALTATGYAGQDSRVSVIVIRATESGTRLPIRYSAIHHICGRGTLLYTLKSVISVYPLRSTEYYERDFEERISSLLKYIHTIFDIILGGLNYDIYL